MSLWSSGIAPSARVKPSSLRLPGGRCPSIRATGEAGCVAGCGPLEREGLSTWGTAAQFVLMMLCLEPSGLML